MRVLLVGAGGVGSALARIAGRRPFAEVVIADYDRGVRKGAADAALDPGAAGHVQVRPRPAHRARLTLVCDERSPAGR